MSGTVIVERGKVIFLFFFEMLVRFELTAVNCTLAVVNYTRAVSIHKPDSGIYNKFTLGGNI